MENINQITQTNQSFKNTQINYPFVFLDESGTCDSEQNRQPFYCLGFLIIKNPEQISIDLIQKNNNQADHTKKKRKQSREKLSNILKNGEQEFIEKAVKFDKELNIVLQSTSHLEYHFSKINRFNLASYKKFIDCCKLTKFDFYCLALKRKSMTKEEWQNFKQKSKDKIDYWTIYSENVGHLANFYAQTKNSCFTLIADFYPKRNKAKNLTDMLVRNSKNKITNVLVTESVGQPLIQLCDLILGSINLLLRVNTGVKVSKEKLNFAKYLLESLKLSGVTKAECLLKLTGKNTQTKHDRNFVLWKKMGKKREGFQYKWTYS